MLPQWPIAGDVNW